ncbi:NAD(P)/FAD-dependent oxidoreductase [Pedosphaera parvula]|uniref:FAD dependent oxidoreductase n=1 Tax=Pedosphaera parvula (strain Ellin514) TaxID=320771 RepID=B9XGA1_PEDPL|nr:NAD(P)/FAD-dependent oxidoreductase [Pedosphaera parvula]EEF61263.1 FAD dependent oxidoreductase [Pedosphaera parvula Ellin514]
MAAPTRGNVYDVVVIGGALSGASTAILLLRERPGLRILIVEKSAAFTRRVGEATVEISTYFLTHSLGLMQYLNETHLNKQGLRFWFANEQSKTLAEGSEIGGRYMARVPAFLVDRATMDEEVLRRACGMGAELCRMANVQTVELAAGGNQKISIKYQDRLEQVESRWVVDASGVAATLARQQGWWRANTEHPTTSVWSRWKGVKDWDGIDLAKKFPCWAKACYGTRGTATNHLMGDGWWAWMIALKGGDVSIGVVFDQRIVNWPEGGSMGQRLKEFLLKHPVARELMADAEWTEGDVHWRKNLPYLSTTFAGDGFSLVGDAAGFIDPFYSPGMDWIAFTATCTAQLILAQQRGESIAAKLQMNNLNFSNSYKRWFEAIYQDKYEYIGDYELLRLAFLMDLGCYYLGVASQPFKRGVVGLTEPIFTTTPSIPFYYFIRTYNRRFAKMARSRRARNCLGAKNNGRRFMFKGYSFAPGSAMPIVKAIAGWGLLELKEGWRTWFQSKKKVSAVPGPMHDTAIVRPSP